MLLTGSKVKSLLSSSCQSLPSTEGWEERSMANEQDYSALEVRVKKLEDQLAQSRAQRLPADVSPEEFEAYLKVRSALAYGNCGGGGTHCSPGCEYVRCMARCDVECICGPCNFGGGGFGGGGRFGGL